MHRAVLPTPPSPPPAGELLALEGEEARHLARSRRARAGEPIELLDGAGLRALGTIERVEPGGRRAEPAVVVRVESAAVEPRRGPRVAVFAPPPKGDRLSQMIDQLSQVGADSWTPLVTARSERDADGLNAERLERIAREAVKQCGRAHALGLGPPERLEAVLARDGWPLVLAHAGECGVPPAGDARVLIGPEGGWTGEELAACARAGAAAVSFGPHVMRIETAAVVAAAALVGRGTLPA